MIVLTEGRHTGEGLLYEADNFYSRAQATMLAGSVADPGQVLGQVTVSEKYRPWNPDNTDGSEIAVAISIDPVDATAADKDFCALVRHAAWARADLVMPSTVTTAEKAAAIESLEVRGIIIR